MLLSLFSSLLISAYTPCLPSIAENERLLYGSMENRRSMSLSVASRRKYGESSAEKWLLSGLFGLAFGTLCSLTYFPVGGVQMVIAWIISGLSFDVVHAGGNFLLALLLYHPLRKALDQLERRLPQRA